jgi:hypothetical protein
LYLLAATPIHRSTDVEATNRLGTKAGQEVTNGGPSALLDCADEAAWLPRKRLGAWPSALTHTPAPRCPAPGRSKDANLLVEIGHACSRRPTADTLADRRHDLGEVEQPAGGALPVNPNPP